MDICHISDRVDHQGHRSRVKGQGHKGTAIRKRGQRSKCDSSSILLIKHLKQRIFLPSSHLFTLQFHLEVQEVYLLQVSTIFPYIKSMVPSFFHCNHESFESISSWSVLRINMIAEIKRMSSIDPFIMFMRSSYFLINGFACYCHPLSITHCNFVFAPHFS